MAGWSEAFQVLVRASQRTNRKVHDIVKDLVSSGELPVVDPGTRGRIGTVIVEVSQTPLKATQCWIACHRARGATGVRSGTGFVREGIRGMAISRSVRLVAVAATAFSTVALTVLAGPGGANARTATATGSSGCTGSTVSANHAAPAGVRPRPVSPQFLVPDQAAYARDKAAANAATARLARPARTAPLAPVKVKSWQGINDTTNAPSDTTSAVGTTRFIEFINADYALYNKTSTVPWLPER